ncbi:MAG TPA: helix-turn-helix domain-containing protein [Ktedonobacteraceae bacterium]|nr:helix-turn-helix domain-containing protein [Ktedonobacteraceae bacterium]
MADANLKAIREHLGVSQEGLARRTRNLTTRTVANAERGKRVTYESATQILEAVNELLTEAGNSPVTLDQLGLNLY